METRNETGNLLALSDLKALSQYKEFIDEYGIEIYDIEDGKTKHLIPILKGNKKIVFVVTHKGSPHPDESSAAGIASMVTEFSYYTKLVVFRVNRDEFLEEVLPHIQTNLINIPNLIENFPYSENGNVLVCDIGRDYDPKKGMIDHHQVFNKTFYGQIENFCNENWIMRMIDFWLLMMSRIGLLWFAEIIREWVIYFLSFVFPKDVKMSSLGLLWLNLGKVIITSISGRLKFHPNSSNMDMIYRNVYDNFIVQIDALDNGVQIDKRHLNSRSLILPEIFSLYKTNFLNKHKKSEEAFIKVFREMILKFQELLTMYIENQIYEIKGRKKNRDRYKQGKYDAELYLLIFDEYLPGWQSLVHNDTRNIKFVCWKTDNGCYSLQCVPKRRGSMKNKRSISPKVRDLFCKPETVTLTDSNGNRNVLTLNPFLHTNLFFMTNLKSLDFVKQILKFVNNEYVVIDTIHNWFKKNFYF